MVFLYAVIIMVGSTGRFHEYPSMNDAPAENQLDQIPGGYIVPVLEDGNGMNTCLLFDTVLKLFHHVFAQFPVYDQPTHLLVTLPAGNKFQGEITLR